jgi:hypothetical protein
VPRQAHRPPPRETDAPGQAGTRATDQTAAGQSQLPQRRIVAVAANHEAAAVQEQHGCSRTGRGRWTRTDNAPADREPRRPRPSTARRAHAEAQAPQSVPNVLLHPRQAAVTISLLRSMPGSGDALRVTPAEALAPSPGRASARPPPGPPCAIRSVSAGTPPGCFSRRREHSRVQLSDASTIAATLGPVAVVFQNGAGTGPITSSCRACVTARPRRRGQERHTRTASAAAPAWSPRPGGS